MVAAPVFMLRTCKSNGDIDKFLPSFSQIDMSPVYCDSGTIQFSYPLKGVNYDLLREDVEIAVLMNGVEIPELRSVIETVDGDDAADAEGGALWKYTARTMAGKLESAIVYPFNWVGSAENQVLKKITAPTWSKMTVGFIMNQLLIKAQARGALQGFTWDFTDTRDSENNAWTYKVDYAPEVGKDYLSVLKEFNTSGYCEFRVDGRVIHMWDTNKMGVDRSTGSKPLVFRKGRDIKESPRKVDTRSLRSAALIAGADNSVMLEVEDGTAQAAYGRREVFYSAGSTTYKKNADGSSSLSIVGDNYLSTIDAPQLEITHGLHFETESNPRPITNFNVGDWAFTDVGRGMNRFRILQWVMSVASDGAVTGSITMNYMFNTQLSQVSSALADVTNGSVNAGSAPQNDGMPPAQVVGVIPTSGNYFVNNIPRATLNIVWSPVTANADGSDITDLDYYEVNWQYTEDGNAWRGIQRVEQDSNIAIFQNLEPGAGVRVRVRATDVWSNHGEWSPIEVMTTAGDTIAPIKPAAPVVTSNVGALQIVWSGLDSTGQPQPVDLDGVEVHVSTSDFTPSDETKKDVLPPGVLTTTLTQGLTYGQEYWVKLVAVDTTGNRSEPSDTTDDSHVVLKQVVSTEIGTGQVGLGQTSFSDVGNLVEDGTFELESLRATRTTLMGSQRFAFDNSTASNGSWSIRSDAWAGASSESIRLQGSLPVKPGERVFGAADYRQSADVPSNSYLSLAVRWLDKNGAYLDNTGIVNPVYYTLTDNGFAPKDNVWHSRVTGVSQTAPVNAVTAEIWLITTGRNVGTVWIDAVEVRKQIDTLMIGQAAITTALIADLAVNNAKIADLSVGKLTAGTLNASILLAARIKTSDLGARVEMNAGGFAAFNDEEVQTVDISSVDGTVSIIGSLRSGVNGQRLVINPSDTSLPEIRFYPTSGDNFGYLNAFSADSDVSIGLNTGTYVESENGVEVNNRLWMGPDFIDLQVVKSASQAQYGGVVNLSSIHASIGRVKGGLNDNLIDFWDDGKMRFTGEVDYWASNQCMLIPGTGGWTDGPYNSYVYSYGPTQTSAPRVIVQLNDSISSGEGGNGCSVQDLTTTSFTTNFARLSNGAQGSINYWAYRL